MNLVDLNNYYLRKEDPNHEVRFEFIMAVKMTVFLFWVVTLCGLTGRYQSFGETYFLYLQG
jgi:hypothetical protein